MKKHLKITAWLVVIVIAVVALLLYWQHEKLYPSTKDTYVRANIVHISPQVSGPITKLYVENYQAVKKGQPLLQIDPRPFQIAVDAAEAQLALALKQEKSSEAAVKVAQTVIPQREAQYKLAQQNAKRILALVKDGQASQQQGDQVTTKLNVTKAALSSAYRQLDQAIAELGEKGTLNANVRAAQAKLNQAKLNLSYTTINAPTSGTLVNLTVRPGTQVQAGQALFDIVENQQWWVDANFKETDLERIHKGQSATITTDMYPNHPFKGVVYKISPGSGAAFSLLPPENATGNWVKVTQRFPVKVMITNPSKTYPLRVGASANITINTTS